MKVMLILRGIAGHFLGRSWPRGALDEPPALAYAKARGYQGRVLDVSGETGVNSEQVRLAIEAIRSDPFITALYGFSGGGYNVKHILGILTGEELKRLELVVVLGAPNYAAERYKGSWELVYRTDPPAGHMAGPQALLQELQGETTVSNNNDPVVVARMQAKLTEMGVLDPPADGILGPITLWAIEYATGSNLDGDAVITDDEVAKVMEARPLPLDLSGDDFATWIVQAMVNRAAWICRHPDCVNIAYVEACNPDGTPNRNEPNHFHATRALVRIDLNGKPHIVGAWEATTTASRHWTVQPMNPGGAARIALGQQRAWSWGEYHGDALRQARNLNITRDPRKTYKRYGPTFTGMFGIHHHQGYNYPTNDEGLSSAGCCVGRLTVGHQRFMGILATDPRQKLNGHFLWSSTVMEYAEIEAVKDTARPPAPSPAPLPSPVPAPIPAPAPAPAASMRDQILEAAKTSKAATYSWHGRGEAPIGYTKGMAMCYGMAFQAFRNGSGILPTPEMSRVSAHDFDRDALAHYGIVPQSEADAMRKTWTLLVGLGMRESSGKFCEGRDRSASNTTAETAEAGAFQTSWNIRAASVSIIQLFEKYKATPGMSWVVFHQDVKCSESGLENYGSGDGRDFQRLCKDSPEFAAMVAAVGLRAMRKHWGPINRKEAEYRREVEDLLRAVENIIDAAPRGELLRF